MTTSKNYFKALKILHLAMICGIVFFGIVISILTTKNNIPVAAELSEIFRYIVPVITILGTIVSNIVFKKKIMQLSDDKLSAKMNNYRAALIIKYALLEGPAIFAIITTFITGNTAFLIYAGILVLLMLYARPSVQTAINDLTLGEHESSIISNPDGTID